MPQERTDLAKLSGKRIGEIKLERINGNSYVVFYNAMEERIFLVHYEYLFDGEGNRFDLDNLPDLR